METEHASTVHAQMDRVPDWMAGMALADGDGDGDGDGGEQTEHGLLAVLIREMMETQRTWCVWGRS